MEALIVGLGLFALGWLMGATQVQKQWGAELDREKAKKLKELETAIRGARLK